MVQRVNIDTGAYSPAKYPRIKTTKKRKAKTVNEDSKKKVRNNLTLKLPEPQGNESTLDSWLNKPRNPTRVRFCDHVLVKEIIPSYVGLLCAWTTIRGLEDTLAQIVNLLSKEKNKNFK